jgi:hypothetical protein
MKGIRSCQQQRSDRKAIAILLELIDELIELIELIELNREKRVVDMRVSLFLLARNAVYWFLFGSST